MVRQAAFKGLREDKPADEVEAETPAPADETALRRAARPAARRRDASSHGLGGGHGRHHLPPRQAAVAGRPATATPVTKLDLAQYFEAVGDWMMPHIKGRPCSIIRTPDGIDGQHFFQRHAMKGASSLFDEVERVRRPQALPADRPRRGPGRRRPDRRRRTAPVELPARPAGAARPAGVRPRSRAGRRVRRGDRGARGRSATGWRRWAWSASARPPAARACTWSRR